MSRMEPAVKRLRPLTPLLVMVALTMWLPSGASETEMGLVSTTAAEARPTTAVREANEYFMVRGLVKDMDKEEVAVMYLISLATGRAKHDLYTPSLYPISCLFCYLSANISIRSRPIYRRCRPDAILLPRVSQRPSLQFIPLRPAQSGRSLIKRADPRILLIRQHHSAS